MAGPPGPDQVRVKRCGKSAPAPGATRTARQTPPGARPSVGRLARPMSPGRPHRWMTTHPDPRRDRRTEPRLQADSPSHTRSDQPLYNRQPVSRTRNVHMNSKSSWPTGGSTATLRDRSAISTPAPSHGSPEADLLAQRHNRRMQIGIVVRVLTRDLAHETRRRRPAPPTRRHSAGIVSCRIPVPASRDL